MTDANTRHREHTVRTPQISNIQLRQSIATIKLSQLKYRDSTAATIYPQNTAQLSYRDIPTKVQLSRHYSDVTASCNEPARGGTPLPAEVNLYQGKLVLEYALPSHEHQSANTSEPATASQLSVNAKVREPAESLETIKKLSKNDQKTINNGQNR